MAKSPQTFEDIDRKASLANLHAIMKYRECTISSLARMTKISRRTLESYVSGRVSLHDAKAGAVLKIALALDVDMEILLGEEPLEKFYRREKSLLERRRNRMPRPTEQYKAKDKKEE